MFKFFFFAALLAFVSAKPATFYPGAYSPVVSTYGAYPAVSAYSAYPGVYPGVSAYSAYSSPLINSYSAGYPVAYTGVKYY